MDLRHFKKQRTLTRSPFSETYDCGRCRLYTYSFLVALPSFVSEPDSESTGLNTENQSFKTTKNVFPEFLGYTWTYNVSRVSGLINDESRQYEIGQFTRRIASIETGINDYVRIIAVDQSGENFLSQCATTLASGDLDIWYVIDNHRFYTACSKNEAYEIAMDLRNEVEEGPTERLLTPDYVLPFEVGNLWAWDPSLPPREDTNYQWHIQAKVDVDVAAGRFEECYRIVLSTLGSSTIKWVCPGIGLVAEEYHHYGAVDDYRAELVSYGLAETGDLSAVPDFSKSGHVEIWLGSLNKDYGLILGPSLDDGQHKVVTIDEVSARQTVAINEDAPNAYLYFHVDDSFDFNDTNNITIYVEYFDEGSGPIFLDYDTIPHGISGDVSSMYKSTFLASRSDSYTWKNAQVTIGDARFGNHQHYNADFRLSTQQTPLTIRYVRIDKSQ